MEKNIYALKNKSVLITGATGLVGAYLSEFLIYLNTHHALGIDIFALSSSEKNIINRFSATPKLTPIIADLSIPFTPGRTFDYIIHAASPADPYEYKTHPTKTMKTNLIGTMSLMENATHSDSKFLFISSGEVYGDTGENAATEDTIGKIDITNVRACYPESKRASETYTISYASEYGIHVNIARLCYIYGPTFSSRSTRADADFLLHAKSGTDITMHSTGTMRRTYCYVADAVSAILHILINGENMTAYNVANPKSVASLREFADTIANAENIKVHAPVPDGTRFPNSVLDANRLIKTGWQPIYDLPTGIKHTLLQI